MKFGCPMCDASIIGPNEKVLSAELRDHLAAAHKLDVPASRASGRVMGKGKDAFGAKSTVAGKKVEDAFGAEAHGREHRLERVKSKKMGLTPVISVICPFCDARIEGADEEEETNLVRQHMMEEHKLS